MELTKQRCRYFALCTNDAEGTTVHPIINTVPTCPRCADRFGLTLAPFADPMRDVLLYLRRAVSNTPTDGRGIDVINIESYGFDDKSMTAVMTLDLRDGTTVRLNIERHETGE